MVMVCLNQPLKSAKRVPMQIAVLILLATAVAHTLGKTIITALSSQQRDLVAEYAIDGVSNCTSISSGCQCSLTEAGQSEFW